VAAEFERNFAERGELGAAFAATLDGELIVDLWGGVADRGRGRPWERDTLQVIFSGSKGLVAICVLLLIERRELQLDSRVADFWPEFAAAGKGQVTVAELVTHTARLPGFAAEVTAEDLVDDHMAAALLAAQPQFDDERAVRCYHPLTYGWLCGELIRRVDGRSIGSFFAEEIADPLGLEIYIGLPAELEDRVSRIELGESWGALPISAPEEIGDDELMRSVYANPPFLGREMFPWNRRGFHAAEIPGAGAIGTARSVARLYGELDGLLSPETLALGTTELERRVDGFAPYGENVTSGFGVGFLLQNELMELGPPADAFGHGGAGGSSHGCWPTERVGFSYAMNLLRDDFPHGDPRPKSLLSALDDCVAGARA
jgi:CubicO group peptidase (beta-lactamase class C family)